MPVTAPAGVGRQCAGGHPDSPRLPHTRASVAAVAQPGLSCWIHERRIGQRRRICKLLDTEGRNHRTVGNPAVQQPLNARFQQLKDSRSSAYWTRIKPNVPLTSGPPCFLRSQLGHEIDPNAGPPRQRNLKQIAVKKENSGSSHPTKSHQIACFAAATALLAGRTETPTRTTQCADT